MTKKVKLRHICMLALSAAIAAAAVTGGATAALARHVNPPTAGSATCSLATAGVNAVMVLGGTGFSGSSQYVVYMSSPGGTGASTVNTDASGNLVAGNFWAYWSGTYTATIYSEGHQSALVASCSTTVV